MRGAIQLKMIGWEHHLHIFEKIKSFQLNKYNQLHSSFETQRRSHQKSKTGVSVAPQKGFMSSKNLIKNEKQSIS